MYPANKPEQPVIRVSYNDAMEYCKILSQKTGLNITLPTEAQWEWACRGGSDEDFWFGNLNAQTCWLSHRPSYLSYRNPHSSYQTRNPRRFLPEYKVVRGGSYIERPKYSTAYSRKGFYPYQCVFNVGFRVIIED